MPSENSNSPQNQTITNFRNKKTQRIFPLHSFSGVPSKSSEMEQAYSVNNTAMTYASLKTNQNLSSHHVVFSFLWPSPGHAPWGPHLSCTEGFTFGHKMFCHWYQKRQDILLPFPGHWVKGLYSHHLLCYNTDLVSKHYSCAQHSLQI